MINISGGTEVGGCLLAPTPVGELEDLLARRPGARDGRRRFGDDGEPLGPDQVGELVCRRPWPGMTQSLWNDDERFIETYWSRFPGVWVHGDWASYDEAASGSCTDAPTTRSTSAGSGSARPRPRRR